MSAVEEPDRDIGLAVLAHQSDPAQRAVDEVKAHATRQARAARRGAELVKLEDGSYLGFHAAWHMHIHLADVPAVEQWLKRIGA